MTKVYLEGAMGKQFGREWELEADSVPEALRIIDANKPGVFNWIRDSLNNFPYYKVVCEYTDGRKEDLDSDTLWATRKPESIYIVPVIEGASAGTRFVIGAILAVVGYGTSWFSGPVGAAIGNIGVALMLGSVIEALSPKPTQSDPSARKDKTSYYFDGPVNTSVQGVPVPLIYGKIRAGSHAISASLTIDQLM
jgi:predicted phage tail protein